MRPQISAWFTLAVPIDAAAPKSYNTLSHMNGKGKRIVQGAYSEHGPGFALCLALVSIFIPLPFFIIAVVLLVLTIVRFRASPAPVSPLPVCAAFRLSPRSPPC
jgi:hypothetical protein